MNASRKHTRVEIHFGHTTLEADVPNLLSVIVPNDVPGAPDARAEIRRAIADPIGSPRLREIAKAKRDAAIVINDITRPCPTQVMVEGLLEELEAAGMDSRKVTLVVATGNHRPATPQEIVEILGKDLAASLRVINHVCTDDESQVYIGTTDGGVPVWVNKAVAHADLRIVTGLITPHHAAGFSGGRKSILPGVTGLQTLKVHHSLPIRPYEAAMGWYRGNPFHEESLKAARMLGVDFMVNTVDNAERQVVQCVAGDVDAAHQVGVETCRKIWEVPLPQKADVVITSPGGYPRDIDMHQSQKAISPAELAAKEGGVIILAAECSDGVSKFGRYLLEAQSPQDVIDMFKRDGYDREAPSKAFMWARALVKHPIIVVARGVADETLEKMFMIPAKDINTAIEKAREIRGQDATFLTIPYASDIIPISAGGI
jgi:nickel-dependent lactate racemase